jgi:hypothetical protein
MAKPKFQYAKLPEFQYQSFNDRHYQTFDRQTLKLSYLPIIPKATVSLPLDSNASVADPEPEKGGDTDNPVAEDKSSEEKTPEDDPPPAAEESSPSEPEGKLDYISLFPSSVTPVYS